MLFFEQKSSSIENTKKVGIGSERHLRDRFSEPPLPIARGIVGDLRKWPLFPSLQPEFAKTIRLFCAFGEKGTEVLLITESDEGSY